MDSRDSSGSIHRDGRLVVCRHGSDAVRAANREIEELSSRARAANRAATPAPAITEMVSVQDRETESMHLLHVHRLDYRPRGASEVGDVVVFSEPRHAAYQTKCLQLATPAHYREDEELGKGIRDVHDGTLTKDSTRWAKTVVPAGTVTSSRVSFGASSEPWIYCACHYKLNHELSRLRQHFADRYKAATTIRDPNAFAIWLGIDFALNLDKTTDVRLGALEQIGYALSSYNTSLWPGSGPIDTVVHVYHGPVHYEDSSGHITTQEDWLDPFASPRAWFTKKTHFEAQNEYRFAVSTLGDPVEPKHYIAVSPELRELTSAI